MLDLDLVPFLLALGLLIGLLLFEMLAHVVGASLLGSDGPEVELVPPGLEAFDLDPGIEPDVEKLLDLARVDQDTGGDTITPASAPTGFAAVLGIGRVPFLLWFAAFLLAFGVSGLALQAMMRTAFGSMLPWFPAAALGLCAGVWFARRFAVVFESILPRTETSATRMQFLGGLRGIVTQGHARRGSPAEIRVRDRHGNLHHLRCEPFRDDDVIPEGTEILTVRLRVPLGERLRGDGTDAWKLRLLPLFPSI